MRMTEYGVNVPDDLLERLEEDQLVLFLGAGISKDAPSNLPDFTKLTKDICKETGVSFTNKLSLDYNLSKVLKAGYDVHERVLEKINPQKSNPNAWHETLLRWFGSEKKVRIVTTNFDLHLSNVATNQLGWNLQEYVAPALPLGDDFHGIIYLHGRVDQKESIVVTGEDFGKAYLNHAWAARFLQAMFAKYTVVFIGYSNRDPLVRYLTSGLSVCANKHYSFCGNDSREDWVELDIETILFEQPSGEKYKAMLHVARAIAKQCCMSELEHENLIRDILTAKKEALLTPQEQDYLLRSLLIVNRRNHFCRYANGTVWFQWAIQHIGEVKSLFDPFVRPETSSREYISWIGERCFINANDLLLQELAKSKLGVSLWYELASAICYRKLDFTNERLISWIYILLRDASVPGHWGLLQDMLMENKLPNIHVRMAVFSCLAKPTVQYSKPIFVDGESVERAVISSISIRSNDAKELCEYWQTALKNYLPEIYDHVRSLVTLYLTEAYYMIIDQGGWSFELDEVSCGRERIVREKSNDGFEHIRSMDPIIDAAVDLIQWCATNNLLYLNRLIDDWSVSKPPILRRLSLYAVSITNWSDDEKYLWIQNTNQLYGEFFYSEPYQLLSSIYKGLSSEQKDKAIDDVIKAVRYENPDDLDCNRGIRTYYLLKSLVEKDCSNEKLAAALRTVQTILDKAGMEYQSVDKGKLPVMVDMSALLTGDILVALQWYEENAQSEDYYCENSNKEKFEIAFKEKVSQDLEWAISIISILCQKDNGNIHYLCRIVMNILGDAELTQRQQVILYNRIRGITTLEPLGNSIASFLRKRADKGFAGYSQHIVDELLKCVDYVLDWAIKIPFKKDQTRRWLDSVITHPVSDLTLVLLQVISDLGKAEKYIVAVTERLSRLLEASQVSQIAEVICGSQVHFLYAIAPDWATKKIVLLFDWSRSMEQAERAWDGFLFWGRFSRNLIDPLLRNFVASVDFLEYLDEVRYCEYLAWLTMSRYIEKPLTKKTLRSSVQKLNVKQREQYFGYLGNHLSGITDKNYSHWVWNNVLLPLLQIRRSMVMALTAGELLAMLRWIAEFSDYGVDLVEKVTGFSTDRITECYQLNHFDEADICEKYPEETATLWIWLGNSLTPGEVSNRIYAKVAEKLLSNDNVLGETKRKIRESLSKIGLSTIL